MTLCPVAIAIGCKKCPVFSICPVKGVIGDAVPDDKGAGAAKKGASASSNKKK